MDARLTVRVLKGLACKVQGEYEVDRDAVAFALMLAIKERTGLHWRRQRLVDQSTGLPIGEGARFRDVFPDGGEAEVLLVHCDSSALPPIEDRDTVLAMVRLCGEALAAASRELRADKDLVLTAVRSPGAFRHAERPLQCDLEVVRIAVASDPKAFCHSGKLARKDLELATLAVNANPELLAFVHADLLKSADFVEPHVARHGLLLQHTSAKLQKATIKAAVSENGLALEFVKKEMVCCERHLDNDAEIVLAAVQQNGMALKYASTELRADAQVVRVAIQQDLKAAKFIESKEAIYRAVRDQPHALKYAQPGFRDDAEVVEAAFAKDPECLAFAFKQAALQIVRHKPDTFKYLKASLKEDPDVLSILGH